MPVQKLIVLRHGELEWNNSNKFCGWHDVGLTEKGKEEARYAARLIKEHNLKPTKLYTSKLTRSIHTGDIMLEELGRLWCDEVKSWRFNERHYGAFQGRDKSEVYKELGKDKYNYIRRDFHGLPPLQDVQESGQLQDERYDYIDIDKTMLPKGESLLMVMERLIPFIQHNVVAEDMKHDGRTVLIATHGSIVRSLIKHFNNVSDSEITKINAPTGIPLVFEFDQSCEHAVNHYYLDPELARIRTEKVKNEGKA